MIKTSLDTTNKKEIDGNQREKILSKTVKYCNHSHLLSKFGFIFLIACHNVYCFVACSFFCSAFYYLQIFLIYYSFLW